MAVKYDFSGYATKNNLKCSDGRVIRKDAFKHNDGKTVPLVWQHQHDGPANILGHAVLENREDGVYTYGKFNDTDAGKNAKMLVDHGDITSLSIYANQLKQQSHSVLHGDIKEVSLVLSGANPGASIQNLSVMHGDGNYYDSEEDVVIYSGEELSMDEVEKPVVEHAEGDERTIKDVFETLNEEQKTVVYAMLAHAMVDPEEDDESNVEHNDEGGAVMKTNVFDNKEVQKPHLTHDQMKEIFASAQKCGSFKEAFLAHAATYGFDDPTVLFPDAKAVTSEPDLISRRMEWVQSVISGTHHTPFSRIKSTTADITADEARAKGYVKGNLKKEEIVKLLKRITTPVTIYKKQKLDRDDILDITELDVVAWLRAEMRIMLDEEIARAVLVSDGRDPDDEDKINEENVRPIWTDAEMYSMHPTPMAQAATGEDQVEFVMKAMANYKGSGSPVYYTTAGNRINMLLSKDTMGRRLYNSNTELASALGVSKIVDVEVMENLTRAVTTPTAQTLALKGIIVNLRDYNIGADKGGQVTMFDDFDIDYNQYKYLLETRISGALVRPASAIVVEQVTAAG